MPFKKTNLNINWKGGRPKCLDCGKQLWDYRSSKCLSCHAKYRNSISSNNNAYMDGRSIIQYHCKDCGKGITYQSALYGLGRCYSCAKKGQLTHGKGNFYNKIYMRSSYEIAFAFFLDCSEVKYQYEPKFFDLGNTTYTPDFYLPEFDCYIEIKGYWRDDAKKKFKLFKKLYPENRIKIFNQGKLLELGIL